MLAWQLWLTLAVVFAIGEVVTTGFFLLWFAIGAAVSAVAAALGLGLVGQLTIFLAVSALLILFTRPLVHRMIEKRRPAYQTNVGALVGKIGTVVRRVDAMDVSGQVKIEGEVWTAFTAGAAIPEGALVLIDRVDGVKLHVRPVEDRFPAGPAKS